MVVLNKIDRLITNACPLIRSQKSSRRKLVPIPLIVRLEWGKPSSSEKKNDRNKDLRSHLGIKLGTFRTEDRAVTDCAYP